MNSVLNSIKGHITRPVRRQEMGKSCCHSLIKITMRLVKTNFMFTTYNGKLLKINEKNAILCNLPRKSG